MDPLGFGAIIFSAIAWGYWGAAAIALLFAFFCPKTIGAKLLAVSIIIALFGYLPISAVWKTKSANATYLNSCKKSVINVGAIEPVLGFYASNESLNHDDMDFGYIIRYMLERRMTFLETDAKPKDRMLGSVSANDIENSNAPYISFFLTNSNDTSCHWFNAWVANYPALKLPPLRANGLPANVCIGAKGISKLESRYRLRVAITPILIYEHRYGMWENMLTITDSTSHQQVADFRLFVGHDIYGNRNVLCDKKVDAERFSKLVPIIPDERYAYVSPEIYDEPPSFDLQDQASPYDIREIVGIRGVLSKYDTTLISDDGLTWFEPKYSKEDVLGSFFLSGYYLVTLRDGKLRKTLVRLGDDNIKDFTGLLITPKSVRFVAMSPDRKKYWLLEYSNKGMPKKAFPLSESQLQSLRDD